MMNPTFEQQELLNNIVNTRQRDALLGAIAIGERIPTYAWTPIPVVELTDQAQNIIDDAAEAVREESERTNRSFDDTLGDIDLSWKVTDLLDKHQEDEIIHEGFYSTPIDASELIGCDPDVVLFNWIYFNPMGPSTIELVLWEDRLKERFAVGVIHTHPFDPSIYVHGVFKKSLVNSTVELNRAIANLIVHSHNQDIVPILPSLPTSIMIFDDTPIDRKVIKNIFKRAADYLEAYNINDDCELLEEYRGDPWGRTAIQRDRAIESAVTGINPFDVARPADWDSIFDRWWYLVTEQEHVMSEVTEYPNAYKGSIDFRNGRFSN